MTTTEPVSFLGVDGGGTKTALCVITSDGRLRAWLEAPSSYYLGAGQGSGPELVREVLAVAVPEVCAAAGVRPADLCGAFFGLPGYGEASADLPVLDAAPGAILSHTRYRCDNDMVCGWAGSLALEAGVNVVSGTGSISYGEREHLRVRVGGWGELVGDEGSAYWLGLRGLQAWSQMTDGRAPPGPLHRLLSDRLRLPEPLDLVSMVHEVWGGDRRTIAALAPVVVEAAEQDDEVARSIVHTAVAELVRLVRVAVERLEFGAAAAAGDAVPVSCSGGVFKSTLIRAAFAEQLGQLGRFDLRPARFPPAVGAALYAAREAGCRPGRAALARLDRSVAGED
jgi:N-acetylglucosamine kinase-like BadF-type ATPase